MNYKRQQDKSLSPNMRNFFGVCFPISSGNITSIMRLTFDTLNYSEKYGHLFFLSPPSLSLAMPALAMLPNLLPRFSCSPSELKSELLFC